MGHVAIYLPHLKVWIEAVAPTPGVIKGAQKLWAKIRRRPDPEYGPSGVQLRHAERDDVVKVARVELPKYGEAVMWLMRQIGKPYDTKMIVRFLTRQAEAYDTREKFFCSELAGAFLRVGGVAPLAHSEPWEESPGDLYLSPVLFPQEMSLAA